MFLGKSPPGQDSPVMPRVVGYEAPPPLLMVAPDLSSLMALVLPAGTLERVPWLCRALVRRVITLWERTLLETHAWSLAGL